jgi:hypothetical protein
MKRLRRFNESKSDIDYDYVYQCFAELLDDNKAEIRQYETDYQKYITIDLKINQSNPERRDTSGYPVPRSGSRAEEIEKSKIFDYINGVKSNSELLQEVEVALNRLSEEYPTYKVNFDVFGYSIHINIFAGEEKEEQYPF